MSTPSFSGSKPIFGDNAPESTLNALLSDLNAEDTTAVLHAVNEVLSTGYKLSEEPKPENQPKALLDDPELSHLKKRIAKVLFSGRKHLAESVDALKNMASFGRRSKDQQLEAESKRLWDLLRYDESLLTLIALLSERAAQPQAVADGR